MNPVKQEGDFKASITDFGLVEFESGAVGVSLSAHLYEVFNHDEDAWDVCDYFADGVVWLIKKDGSANDNGADSLCNHLGWNGSLLSIEDGTWKPGKCQVTVKSEVYKGETRYRINFVNAINRKPGGKSNVSKTRAVELQQKYGHKFPTSATQMDPPPSRDNSIPF